MNKLQRLVWFLQKRLSPEGYAGLHLTVGVLVVLICGYCFGAIAEDVWENDPIVQVDHQIAVWFNQHATPPVTRIVRAISFLGSVGCIAAISAAVALWLGLRRDWLNLFLLVLTIAGGGLMDVLLKHFFHRERPVLENPLVTLSSYGFPSGHTMGATTLYGLLALLAWENLKNGTARLACIFGVCLLIGLIGFSRIYLGAHYLSDVLGAFAAGLLWLTFCWTAVQTIAMRKTKRASMN